MALLNRTVGLPIAAIFSQGRQEYKEEEFIHSPGFDGGSGSVLP